MSTGPRDRPPGPDATVLIDGGANPGHIPNMAKKPPETWSEQVVRKARELGYSTRKLSRVTGIQRTNLQRILAGHEPRLGDAQALEKVLGVSAKWEVES